MPSTKEEQADKKIHVRSTQASSNTGSRKVLSFPIVNIRPQMSIHYLCPADIWTANVNVIFGRCISANGQTLVYQIYGNCWTKPVSGRNNGHYSMADPQCVHTDMQYCSNSLLIVNMLDRWPQAAHGGSGDPNLGDRQARRTTSSADSRRSLG
jgi:hypothetical protein